MFARLVVISNQRIDFFRISERHLSAEVSITRQEVSKSIATIVTGEHDVDNSFGKRFDVGYQTRTSLVQNQDDGLARLGKGFHQVELVLREEEVGQISRSLAVGVLADAGYDIVSIGGSSNSLVDFGSVFIPPVSTFLIGNTRFVDDVVGTELVGKRLEDSIVSSTTFVSLVALPGVRPATVESTDGVSIRASEQQLLAFGKREDAIVVLEENQRFFSSMESSGSMFGTTEEREVLQVVIRLLEQIESVLQAQYAANGIVDTAHGYFTFLHQLFKKRTEFPIIRVHRHINTGIDGKLDSFLLVFGNVVALPKVINIRPVGHNHTVPVKVFLQPFGQQFVVGMERQAVVHGRVYHNGECAVANHLKIRRKVFLTHILLGNGRRGAVFSRYGDTVTHKVLHTSGNTVCTYAIGVIALKAENCFTAHLSVDVAVFTIVFPHARPARITAQVSNRGISPGNASGFGFVSRDFGTTTGQLTVESGTHVDALRKEGST